MSVVSSWRSRGARALAHHLRSAGATLLSAAIAFCAACTSVELPDETLGVARFASRASVENENPGTPPSVWDIADGLNDPELIGFTTNMSYAPGETVNFKIRSSAAYNVTIYRVGYYDGNGARQIVPPSSHPSIVQPACVQAQITDAVKCTSWSVTKTWTIPNNQISGVYFAKLRTTSAPVYESHILFVVRDDVGESDILFQTNDTTWQAYNAFPLDKYNREHEPKVDGDDDDTSLYNGGVRVSYDRPLRVRDAAASIHGFFGPEYLMVRFLEKNGYDVSYFSGVDTARRGSEISEHKVFLSTGHDEYWSPEMRNAVTAARAAGTHLVFFSGNEMYWKTRWEDNYRTMVCYKTSSHFKRRSDTVMAPADPSGFTGTWRDRRFSLSPTDAAAPENAVTGSIFGVNGHNAVLRVPEPDGKLRLWRNTPTVSSTEECGGRPLAPNTLGFEWDFDEDNGVRPAGLFRLSTTSVSHIPLLFGPETAAAGSFYAKETGVQATHHLTQHRLANGAMTFGAGTIQWSFGLADSHLGLGVIHPDMTQATANLFADMGVQPDTPVDFTPASASTDSTPPTSTITAPPSAVRIGSELIIAGTASDVGGRVAGVEISLDGGTSWRRAEGRGLWRYAWMASAKGTYALKSRAVDDSGNLESPGNGRVVLVDCQNDCFIWPRTAAASTTILNDNPVNLGVRFRSDTPGSILGVSFWAPKSASTRPVRLWTAGGTLLASGIAPAIEPVNGEEEEGVWQTGTFAAPVAIQASTTYVVSYHTTTWAYTPGGLTKTAYRTPLAGLGSGGVYAYASSPAFPNLTSATGNNYFVDPVFVVDPSSGQQPRHLFPGTPSPSNPNVTDPNAAADPWGVELGVEFESAVDGYVSAIRFYRSDANSSQIVNLWRVGAPEPIPAGSGGMLLGSAKLFQDAGTGWRTVTFPRPIPIVAGQRYVASYHTRDQFASTPNYFTTPVSDPPLTAHKSIYRYGKTNFPVTTHGSNQNYWVDVDFMPGAPLPHHIWSDDTIPAIPFSPDPNPVTVGVKFKAEVPGLITGIRFYRHPNNNGPHVATLWAGTNAERIQSFANETSCGWTTAIFTTPYEITPGQVYIASYHTSSGYALEQNYFNHPTLKGLWNWPLRALDNSLSGNGVYGYGPSTTFPNLTNLASNYWVDVVFRAHPEPAKKGVTLIAHPTP